MIDKIGGLFRWWLSGPMSGLYWYLNYLFFHSQLVKFYSILQAASVFVLYATSQANSMAHNQSRKTIYGQDVITAMNEMEFDKFVRPLENSLASTYITLTNIYNVN